MNIDTDKFDDTPIDEKKESAKLFRLTSKFALTGAVFTALYFIISMFINSASLAVNLTSLALIVFAASAFVFSLAAGIWAFYYRLKANNY